MKIWQSWMSMTPIADCWTIIDTLVYTNDIYETGYTGTSTTAVDAMTLAIEYK